jgi:hypothetical protein
VANLVTAVTDDKNLSKAERRRIQVESAARKSRGAKFLKLADKTRMLPSVHWHPSQLKTDATL